MNIEDTLRAIRPTDYIEVMDIVSAAGISVEAWSVKKDGGAAQNARSNPTYVYEWAFGGEQAPTLLCIWHRSLKIIDDQIVLEDCVRDYALELDRIAIDQTEPPEVKSRARSQAKRARKFDSMVQRAFRKGQPVRVVLLEGQHTDEAKLGWASSKVEKRLLDSESWYVHEYQDADGTFRLVRSIPPTQADASTVADSLPDYDALNDLDAPPPGNLVPAKVQGTASGFKRDDAVREFVRARAKGFCEYCNAPGFLLPDGKRYIETHHIIWLSEGGPDTVSNVIALCANHHREVHFGQERKAMEEKMLEKLTLLAPA
jgi:5-methylcytosine-specific restriction protein A